MQDGECPCFQGLCQRGSRQMLRASNKRNEHSRVKVTLRSVRELEEELESRKRDGSG